MIIAAMKKNEGVQGIWSTRERRGHSGKKHGGEVLTEKGTFEQGPESGREEAWR